MTLERIALDTNVLVSSLLTDGPPARLIEVAVTKDMDLVVPEAALVELERTLRTKLRFSEDRWRRASNRLHELIERAPTPAEVPSIVGYRPDDEILAAAAAAGSDVLVTGDRRHLLPLEEHGGMRIVTPQAMLAELLA